MSWLTLAIRQNDDGQQGARMPMKPTNPEIQRTAQIYAALLLPEASPPAIAHAGCCQANGSGVCLRTPNIPVLRELVYRWCLVSGDQLVLHHCPWYS